MFSYQSTDNSSGILVQYKLSMKISSHGERFAERVPGIPNAILADDFETLQRCVMNVVAAKKAREFGVVPIEGERVGG